MTGKNYRLPTEAQWEYAARGGQSSFDKGGQGGFKYAGSNNLNEVAWYDVNSSNKTHPVGQKRTNELGLYDMSGNVWEWCQDWYDADYYKKSPANNPTGPTSGIYCVLRGGSWNLLPSLLLLTEHGPRFALCWFSGCFPIVLAVTLIWFVCLS